MAQTKLLMETVKKSTEFIKNNGEKYHKVCLKHATFILEILTFISANGILIVK